MFQFLIKAKLNGNETEDASITPFVLILLDSKNLTNQLGCGTYDTLADAKTEAAAIVKATLTWQDATDSLSSYTDPFTT